VQPIFSDEEITLARYRNAHDLSFDRAAGWLFEGMGKAFGANAARLAISAENPMLLAGQDVEKVSRANRATSRAYKPALEKITGFDINWNIVSYPNPSWARLVFPDDPEAVAVKSSPPRSSPRAASMSTTPSAHGRRTTRGSDRWTWLNGQAFPRCIIPAPAPTSPSASPMAIAGRRRVRGQERHNLQPEHPHRGSLYHSAQGPRFRYRPFHQAAQPQRHAHHRYRG